MPRLPDRLQAIELAARSMNGELVAIDGKGLPTPEQISEWEGDAKAGRRLFIVGAGMNWGWIPGGVRRPWEPLP